MLVNAAESGLQLLNQPSQEDPQSLPMVSEDDYTPAEVVEPAAEPGIEGLGSVFGSVGDFFRGNPGIALALTAGGAYLLYSATRTEPSKSSSGLAGPSRRRSSSKRSPPKHRKKIPVYRLQ
jgi:hypothetical protein